MANNHRGHVPATTKVAWAAALVVSVCLMSSVVYALVGYWYQVGSFFAALFAALFVLLALAACVAVGSWAAWRSASRRGELSTQETVITQAERSATRTAQRMACDSSGHRWRCRWNATLFDMLAGPPPTDVLLRIATKVWCARCGAPYDHR